MTNSGQLVSIITPVFNRLNDLPMMISSVVQQTNDQWELILVDDGSTDGSLELAQDWALKDQRIKVKSRNRLPKGASACRNIGLDMAAGEYTMFLDSDDLLNTNCLQNRLKLILEEEVDFIVTQTGIIRRDREEITKLWSSLAHQNDIEAFTVFQGWCISSTFFRSAFVKNYCFDESAPCLQDWAFHLEILIDRPEYKKFKNSDIDIYVRSGHAGTRISINTNNFNRLMSRFEIFLKLEKALKSHAFEQETFLLDKQYLKHLNYAVLKLDIDQFWSLYRHWKKSVTFNSRRGRLVKLYLKVQLFVRQSSLRFFHGLIYRMAKFICPKHLFHPNERELILASPMLLEKEIQNILYK